MRYCEAYCRLPVAALYQAFDAGHGTLVWRDATGSVIGSGQVVSRFDNVMRVSFEHRASGAVEAYAGEIGFGLVLKQAGLLRREAYGLCPECRRPVKHLIAREHMWKCTRCHGLVNRSSLIRDNSRLTEKVERLAARISGGRPKGMHNATYNRLVAQLAELRERLGPYALRADSRFEHVVTHHVSGPVKKTVLARSTSKSVIDLIFMGRLIDLLTHHFIAVADNIVNSTPANLLEPLREHLAERIERDAQMSALVLGKVDEFVEEAADLARSRTIIEIPFFGDTRLFRVHSEAGEPLPPCFGQIDEEAQLVRFTFQGSVIDQPLLRVRMNEQQAVLHEHIARQKRAIEKYHNTLRLDARRYLDSRRKPSER